MYVPTVSVKAEYKVENFKFFYGNARYTDFKIAHEVVTTESIDFFPLHFRKIKTSFWIHGKPQLSPLIENYRTTTFFQCHLATLLKTAEELRIKGLAEVSWRDEDGNSSESQNGIQSTALAQVSTVMESPKFEAPNKRKRGRPPIDDYDSGTPNYNATPKLHAKIVSVMSANEENYSNDALSNSDQDMSIWEDDQGGNDADEGAEGDEPPLKVKLEVNIFTRIKLLNEYQSE